MFQFPFRAPNLAFAPDLAEFERLPAASVYKIIAHEGRRELRRPAASLWWSAVAAGFAMSASVIGVAALAQAAPADAPWRDVFTSLGYPFGFLIVILSRLQLFTENTVTPILPLLLRPHRRAWLRTGRLWALVLTGNLIGAAAAAALSVEGGLLDPAMTAALVDVSRHAIDQSPTANFTQGILAGFLIAALVWMLPTLKGQEFLGIFAITYLIGAAGAPHVIAGAVETFAVVFDGQLGLWPAFASKIAPTLAGNVVGGTMLFAALAYGQVWRELRDPAKPTPSAPAETNSDEGDRKDGRKVKPPLA